MGLRNVGAVKRDETELIRFETMNFTMEENRDTGRVRERGGRGGGRRQVHFVKR